MKIIIRFLVLLFCAGFFFVSDAAVGFTNLYKFSPNAFPDGPNPKATNFDGANPDSLVLSGKTLYGTAAFGGTRGDGTVFRVDVDGGNFTNLFNFYLGTFDSQTSTYPDSKGAQPNPGLLLLTNTLYGTTFYGGLHDAGTVFKINTDGSEFALLHEFNFTDGQEPSSGLTLHDGWLYGTTSGGGTNQYGTIFKISPAGGSLVKVFDFQNHEYPYGGLAVADNVLYGFGNYSASSYGLIFRISDGGSGYKVLLDFDGVTGWKPYSTPILSGDTLFGVSYQGGVNGGGNIFRIDTGGNHYTNLFSFQAQSGANTSGSYPYDFGGLVLSGNKLYGTASVSGTGGQGTVFQLNTDGSGFAVLHSFQYSEGGQPEPLLLSNGILYGTAQTGVQGISLGVGSVFSLGLPPSLEITRLGDQVVITWSDPSYSLYSAASVTNSFSKINGATSPYTSALSGAQQFFRLQSN